MRMRQWELIYDLVKDNKCWGLGWFVRLVDEQIDVALNIEGEWKFLQRYRKSFGGGIDRQTRARQRADGAMFLDIKNKELDKILPALEIMLTITGDRYQRLEYVGRAQRTRKKVHEGNSYPLNVPRTAKGH